jgi:hypothetical protein
MKMKKIAKNGRKVKAIGLLFCCFSPLFQKSKKWLKMDEKLALLFCWFLRNYENEKSR